ncbi:MAG: UvrD-helicase domain-containing protein [Ignavibacteria bacterium]|nr:UvrD-helicase domain-containing protein [Ignavibacteria bacterium]
MRFHQEQLDALDLTVHCAVHANAGSGKTSVLTHRFLKILAETQTPMDKVVAITFTRAAAAEMKERIHRRLVDLLRSPEARAEFAHSGSDEIFVKNIRSWINECGRSRISTFHSFCSSIIRQYADELNIDADVRDIEEQEASMLAAKAVDMAMANALDPQSPLHDETLAVFDDVSISAATDLVMRMARSRTFCALLNERTAEDETAWLHRQHQAVLSVMKGLAIDMLREVIEGVADYSHIVPFDSLDEQIRSAIDEAKNADNQRAVDIAVSTMSSWFTQTGTILAPKAKLDASGAAKEFVLPKQTYTAYVTLKKISWDDDRELRLLRLLRILATIGQMASEKYTQLKRDRNGIDFDDMIGLAIELLEKDEVAQAIRSGISYLMVDEFQDTDPEQFRLLSLLVPALAGRDIAGPNIFIVGDDKQSIYGFRDADVRLFRRATQAIRHANLKHGQDDGYRPLSRSYRMHQDLCSMVNTMCVRIFGSVEAPSPEDLLSYDVAYAELVAGITAPTSSALGTCSVVIDEHDELDAVARTIVQILNGSIERNIATFDRDSGEWLVRPPQPGDIAVLLPKNELVQGMADKLRSYNVPFQMHGGRAFFTRPEVSDIRALLTTCVDPSNDLAVATLMRSPYLRCTDAEITAAALTGRRSSLRDGLAQYVARGSASPALVDADRLLETWGTRILTMQIPEFVRSAQDDVRWHETIAKDDRRDQILANVEKTIDIIRSTIDGTGAGIHDAIEALVPPDVDREKEGELVAESDAVQLMTIHAAKGLEYGIVVLAGLNSGGGTSQTILTDQLGFTFDLPAQAAKIETPSELEKMPDVLTHDMNKVLDKMRSEAESRRRLYVALTRAKMHIVISFPMSDPIEKGKALAKMLATALYAPGAKIPYQIITPDEEVERYTDGRSARTEYVVVDHIPAPPPTLISPSAMMRSQTSDEPYQDADGSSSGGMIYGTAIHDALSGVITKFTGMSDEALTSEIVRALSMHDLDRTVALDAVTEILALLESSLLTSNTHHLSTARLETRLVGALNQIVFQGVMDVRFHPNDTTIEIWDWKTNNVASSDHLESVAAEYQIQMCTYAWLCLRSYPECSTVRTRLVFTKAASKGLHQIDHVQEWKREDMEEMEGAMMEAVKK